MDWHNYLPNLSDHLLGNLDNEELDELREQTGSSFQLGRSPATRRCIEQAEHRLGFKLPYSLTSFYLASDGWTSADGFPVGIANILSVVELSLLSECRMRELANYTIHIANDFNHLKFSAAKTPLSSCVVIIDLDGNEFGFAIRSDNMDDWPVITYNPDGCDFEYYAGFIDLMKDGMTY